MADHSLFPILDRFEDVQWHHQDSSMGECRCPAHDDGEKKGKPSLHLKIKDDPVSGRPKLLLLCHAGCSAGDILKALGVGFSALFPAHQTGAHSTYSRTEKPKKLSDEKSSLAHPKPKPKPSQKFTPGIPKSKPPKPSQPPKIACVYSYRDIEGNIVHQTVRFEPKQFRQRRPGLPNHTYTFGKRAYRTYFDPHDAGDPKRTWWVNTLQGIEPIPYNLPGLLQNPDRPIFLCEGEKDADNLRSFGVRTATTVPMGTGKWRDSYSEYFRGRVVYIFPDYDRPRKGQTDPAANAGFDGAKKIAAKLLDVASEVRIVYLPDPDSLLIPKWDVTDWLKAYRREDGESLRRAREILRVACESAEVLHEGHPGLVPSGKRRGIASADDGDDGDNDDNNGTFLSPDENTWIVTESPSVVSSSTVSDTTSTTTATTELITNKPPERSSIVISNFFEESERVFAARDADEVRQDIITATNGWPRRIGTQLFFCNTDPNCVRRFKIDWITNASALFGWLSCITRRPVEFAPVSFAVTKDEIFQELKREATQYEMIERNPHHPRIPSLYYACKDRHEWVSERPGCLEELLSMFCPATDIDRDLMLAFVLTLFWGGPGGKRPLFVITSDSGRGAGKTTFAEEITSLVGGTIQISSNADDEIIRQRLLSPEGMEKRAILLDNVKSNRFSWAELEALITSESISGKKMYVGEGSRPNLITYVITINGPSFSTDLAQRSIMIKLGKPKHSGDWQQQIAEFMSEHRDSIIAEILERLEEPRHSLETYSRWGRWEQEVLSLLTNAEECQKVIKSRQQDLDSERDEATEIQEYFEYQLLKNYTSIDNKRIFITNTKVHEWLSAAIGDRRYTKISACKMLNRMINEGQILRMHRAEHPQRTGTSGKERGVFWTGDKWTEDCETLRPGEIETYSFDDDDAFFLR